MAQRRLVTVFEGIEDRRNRKGLRYGLPGILTVALAAVMCGASSLAAIHRFGKRLSAGQCRAYGFWRGRAPCHSGWYNILKTVDPRVLDRALSRITLAGEAVTGQIMLDGKSLRGARDGEAPALHVLYAFSDRLQQVVGAVDVPPPHNEITAALQLIETLDVDQAIITGDAMFAQRSICSAIIEKDGDYLFRVKDNQPDLQDNIHVTFASDPALRAVDIESAATVEKGHGRIERRQIEISREAVAWIGWPGLQQIARITRTREIKGKPSEEVAYFITSLPRETHGPEELLEIARRHWHIENGLFHVRDVTWREDQSRLSQKNAAQTLSLLRSQAIGLFRRAGWNNMQAAIEDCAANAKAALIAAKRGYF